MSFSQGRVVHREEKCMKNRALVTTFRDWEDGRRKRREGSVRAQDLETDIEGSPTESLDPWRSQTGLATQSGSWSILLQAKFLSSTCRFQSGFWDLYLPCLDALWGLVPLFRIWSVFFSYFFLYFLWIFVAVHGFSLVAGSRGYSLAEAHGLLLVVASPVVEHGL